MTARRSGRQRPDRRAVHGAAGEGGTAELAAVTSAAAAGGFAAGASFVT
ncbi:hypothetical protein [Pseudonocardia sp. 73-21]|nr:hypothetical protein [Pseudonocardia sp. 73-21]